MARLSSWLSADMMHALGWALIHSLWQCVGLAALAAILMTASRRPSIRYIIATGALLAMLAAPAATFLILMRPAATAQVLLPATSHLQRQAPRATAPAQVMMTANAASPSAKDGAAAKPSSRPAPQAHTPDSLAAGILPWLVSAWLCGVALFSLRLAGGFLLLERKWRTQSHAPSARILALCHELQDQLGLTRAIRYLECGWLQTPAMIGWLRPVILLPVTALTGLSETQLRAVIAHELAHIRRHDFCVNFLQILVETLLFYHPAIWWLNRRIRAERELCCDEIAVSLTGDRLEYARTLARMAEWDKASSLAMAANRGSLSERILHVLGKRPAGAGRRILGATGGVLFLAGALGAANALLAIAYPVPPAQAKPVFKVASAAIAAAPVAPILPAEAMPPKTKAPVQPGIQKVAAAEAASHQMQKLIIPALDLSALLAAQIPQTPLLPHIQPMLARIQTRSCALPSLAGKISLEHVPGSDLMTVPVEINGAPKQFLLDFDTGPTEISEPAVAELHLPRAEKAAAFNAIAGQNSILPNAPFFDVKAIGSAADYQARVRVASFSAGDSTARDLQFLVANDRDMGKSTPYDGRLTRRAFTQYDADFDFAGRELRFFTPTGCSDPDQVAYWPHTTVAIVPMALSPDGKMQVQVTIGGQVIDAVMDTGSARTVMRRDIAERLLGLRPGTAEMIPAGDLQDGNAMQVYTHTFAQISFAGGVTANNVPALIQSGSMVRKINRTPVLGSRATFAANPGDRIPDLALGMDVLHQLHLYAAFDQNKLYVTAAANKLYALSSN